MKTTPLKILNLLMIALMLAGAVACNERIPANRPITFGAATGDDDTDDDKITRPNGAVKFTSQFCACNNKTNILVPDVTCNTYCSNRDTSGIDRLYVNFTVSPEIELNASLKTVQGYCSNDLSEDDANVRCELAFKTRVDSDVVSEERIAFTNFTGSGNSGWIDIPDAKVAKGRTYSVTLKAISRAADGTSQEFTSDTIQILKVAPGLGSLDPGPIGLQPVSQYACINRFQNPTMTSYLTASQLHFYFVEQMRPDPLPAGFSTGFCHNIQTYGANDSEEFPRLFEEAGAFTLWRTDDSRMMNLKTPETAPAGTWTNDMDADEIIRKKMAALGVTTNLRFFGKLAISSGPVISNAGNSSSAGTNNPLGWYMRMFIDSSTTNNFSFCPKAEHYASGSPLFQSIGEVVQVDTEGLYLARREKLTYQTTENGQTVTKCVDDDFILVRESVVRQHWFYYQNGAPKLPGSGLAGELAIKNNVMRFFYPFRTRANLNDPPVKQVDQRTYTIVTVDQAKVPSAGCAANDGGVAETPDNTGIPNTIPPHDKRLGCIPNP